jgi:hypothetical protein
VYMEPRGRWTEKVWEPLFWTIADGSVASSAMHYGTPISARTLSPYGRTLTRMISHSAVRVHLSHVYRTLLALSANTICAFFVDYCLHRTSLLISMLVFDIVNS